MFQTLLIMSCSPCLPTSHSVEPGTGGADRTAPPQTWEPPTPSRPLRDQSHALAHLVVVWSVSCCSFASLPSLLTFQITWWLSPKPLSKASLCVPLVISLHLLIRMFFTCQEPPNADCALGVPCSPERTPLLPCPPGTCDGTIA